MKQGYVVREQERTHFITATVVDWIDVFSRKSCRDCIIECFDYCIKNKGMILYGYVIMINHIQLLQFIFLNYIRLLLQLRNHNCNNHSNNVNMFSHSLFF